MNLARIDLSLYAILDPAVEDECALEDFVRLIIEGGATCIQVRCKDLPDAGTLDFTLRVLGVARPARVPVIVNDELEVGLAAWAEGVHLGEGDLPVAVARRRVVEAFEESAGGEAEKVAAGFIIGASARTLEAARKAAEAGADYIGVGPMFSTPSKPGVEPVDPGVIRAMKREISLPIVAIGGINEENAHVPMSHGADGAAVISALRGTDSPREAAARLRAAIEKSREG
jgi:thiamine-phosphate pyrophosphorylase